MLMVESDILDRTTTYLKLKWCHNNTTSFHLYFGRLRFVPERPRDGWWYTNNIFCGNQIRNLDFAVFFIYYAGVTCTFM